MSEQSLLRDLIPSSLSQEEPRIIAASQFSQITSSATPIARSRTPFPAKNLNEFYELVRKAINNREFRENIIDDAKVHFTEETPDYPKDQNVIITVSLVKRLPGAFAQGAPFESEHHAVKNLVPILREEIEDDENPGYKNAILGYIHDNEVKFTIWARTNKVANERALWFEELMQEYSWYYTSQGVNRCLFMKRDQDTVSDINNAKMYGRPLHFFVKTETLRTVSQKKIELIIIDSIKENA